MDEFPTDADEPAPESDEPDWSEAQALLSDERSAAEAMARDDVRDERDWYELLEAA